MKIASIQATPINIPFEAPIQWSGGQFPGTSKAIVQVETDEGIVGLGEAPSADVVQLVQGMGEVLRGRDPLDIAGCETACVPPWQTVQNTDDARVVKAFGAIEMALWDIRGKAWNSPLHQMLGGKLRDEIRFTEHFALREGREDSPEQVVEHCQRMMEEHGSTLFEGKIAKADPELEIRTVKLLRETLGSRAMLRLDGNMQWSLATARRVMREIEPYDIRNYEDPVSTFEELKALRQHTSIPFSTHAPDLRRAVALGVPDAFVTNFAILGGIGRTIRFIGACEAMGVGFWCYSGDAGIATAAYLHVCAAMPWISEPNQSLFRWQMGDVIVGGPFRQTYDVVRVPDGPGLGVELDRAALDHWHRHFVDNGPFSSFHDPRSPHRYRRLPLA